jgi:LemA protein
MGALALGAGLLATVVAWLVDRRRRAYTDVPTTPAAAVFAGRNEVVGRAWAREPLESHRTRTPVIWWRYLLEEERTHTRMVTSTDANGNSHTRTETYEQWHEVDERTDALATFEVVDATGSVPVRLDGAHIDGRPLLEREFRAEDEDQGWLSRLVDDRTGRYRETEDAIAIGDPLFVVGEAVLDETSSAPVLAGDVLVSTRSEASRTGWLGSGAIALTLLGLSATGVGLALLVARGDTPGPRSIALGVVVPLAGLLGAWTAITYNRLRLLAQSIDRAWSLIGVQLQRRHDLIPDLAAAVSAHAAHERTLLDTVTLLRWDASATGDVRALSREAVQQTEEIRLVLARSEAYPELTADESFLRLQRELADTESRIAGSRTFYNDTLTLLRDRSQAVPANLVARFLTFRSRELIPADGFERTVPAIERTFA